MSGVRTRSSHAPHWSRIAHACKRVRHRAPPSLVAPQAAAGAAAASALLQQGLTPPPAGAAAAGQGDGAELGGGEVAALRAELRATDRDLQQVRLACKSRALHIHCHALNANGWLAGF
jgi:hypothetical protein